MTSRRIWSGVAAYEGGFNVEVSECCCCSAGSDGDKRISTLSITGHVTAGSCRHKTCSSEYIKSSETFDGNGMRIVSCVCARCIPLGELVDLKIAPGDRTMVSVRCGL